MSQMSELDLCIQDVAGEDVELRKKITDELECHLNGILPYDEMSEDAQKAICLFEQENMAEHDLYDGHYMSPTDDDDIPLEEDMQ